MTLISYVLTLTPVIFVGLVFLLLGHLRTGILFGTSVPVEFPSSAAGRRILRAYRWRGIAALAVFVVFSIVAIQRGLVGYELAALPVEIAIWFALYFVAIRQTRPFAIQPPLVRTASLARNNSMVPTFTAFVAALLPLVAAALYLHLHWMQIPESFPVHWGVEGQANGWSQRTVIGVYQPIWIGAGILAALFATGISTRYARGGEALRGLVRNILLVTAYLVSFAFTWVALLPLIRSTSPAQSRMPFASIALTLVGFGVVLLLIFWSVQAQARQRDISEPYDGSPDECWYGGMIYFNPEDRAILVPKRLGIGYTLNFGRPVSWLMFAILLLPLGFFLLHRHIR